MKHAKRFVYWDTCIFIAWCNDEALPPHTFEGIDNLIKELEAGQALLITSVITRLEILDHALVDAKNIRRVHDFFAQDYVQEVELSVTIARRAHEIRHHYLPDNDIGLADSIHLASATAMRVDVFHTLDGSGRRKKGKLLGLSQPIAGKYPLSMEVPYAAQASLFGSGAVAEPKAEKSSAVVVTKG